MQHLDDGRAFYAFSRPLHGAELGPAKRALEEKGYHVDVVYYDEAHSHQVHDLDDRVHVTLLLDEDSEHVLCIIRTCSCK